MLTRRGYLTSSLTSDQKRALEVSPEVTYSVSTPLRCYRECKEGYFIPRNFGKRNIDDDPKLSESMAEETIHVEFTGRLREIQVSALDATMDGLRRWKGGVLCLPTGFGKTVLGLKVIAELKLKTIIVVHKVFLMDQWVERIQTFLPGVKLGKIQGQVCDTDCDIIMATIQSIAMKNRPTQTFKGVGLMVIDEAHHTPAETFSNLFFKCNCPYILALTATLERKDNLHVLLEEFIGPVLFREERDDAKNVSVNICPYVDPSYGQPEPRMKNGEISMSQMVSMVCANPERTRAIAEIVKGLSPSRHILILSDRRAQCEALSALIPGAGLYLGGMKKAETEISVKKRVIVATYALVSEGFDLPTLDTLVMASPRSDVNQSVGRILRETKGKKNEPLVIDMVDQWSVFRGQGFKRRKFYKDSGFQVNVTEYQFLD